MEELQSGSVVNYPVPSSSPRPRAGSDAASVEKSATHRVTLNLPVGLIEQLRNAVYWTPGATLASLVRDSLRESLDRLEQRNGARYPPRLSKLRSGRPRKSRKPSPVLTPSLDLLTFE